MNEKQCKHNTYKGYGRSAAVFIFLAVFLGIPIATKSERSGVMSSIVVAVGLIVGYIICANLFLMFGKQGVFNPVFAGLAPTIGFICYGYYKVLMGGGN